MRISKNCLKKICNCYKKISSFSTHREGYVFFENTFESQLFLMNCKFITAKALEQKYNCRTLVFNDYADEQKNDVYKALGFESIEINRSVSFLEKIKSYIEAVFAMRCRYDMKALIRYVHHGVHIGDLIYDHIIRNNPGRYTVGYLNWEKDFKVLQKFFLYADFCRKVFVKYPPKYFVAGDIIYINGVYVRTAMRYGAEVIEVCTGRNSRRLMRSNAKFYPNYHATIRKSIGDLALDTCSQDWRKEMAEHLDGLFQGKGDINARAAYLGKDILSKSEMLDKMGICNDKKIL